MSIWDEVNAEVEATREKRAIQVRFIAQLLAGIHRLAESRGTPMTFQEVVVLLRDELAEDDEALCEVFTRSFCEACEADDVDGSWLLGEW